MSEAVLITLIGIVSSTISATISWLLSRRKYNVSIKTDELENLRNTMVIYTETINNLKSSIHESDTQAKEANQKAEEAKMEVYRLRTIIYKILGEACLNDKCLKRMFYTDQQIKDMLSETLPSDDDSKNESNKTVSSDFNNNNSDIKSTNN